MPVRLALSLHAAEDALRSELMPVNERYPIAEVIDAARAFYERKRRRIFIEYVMLAGVNDRYEQALALARLLAPRVLARSPGAGPPRRGQAQAGGPSAREERATQIFKVNLIPYNPTGSPYEGSSRESIAAFRAALQSHGIDATVRLTRGRDIAAACGQLAALNAQPVAANA
jgi:23S rRNA (adenine2503-C2)-methyltransferase